MGSAQFGNGRITKESTVVATKDEVHCELGGETVILHLSSGTYFGLNPTGTYVWNMLRQPATVAEILARMLDKFEVDADRCEADLLALLDRLSDERLIEVFCEADT